jgi:dihydroorotase-like cyclic amidohydrolase
MFDLIIRGGDFVTPQGVVSGDVAIRGEAIAAIAKAESSQGTWYLLSRLRS